MLRSVNSLPRTFLALLRRHRAVAVLGFVLLTLVVTALGGYGYAHYQWVSAQEALRDKRADEARARLDRCLVLWPRDPEVHLLAARAARYANDFPAAEAHLNRCMELQHGASAATQIEFLLMRVQTGEEDDVAPLLFAYVEENHPESELILESIARAFMNHFRYGPAFDCLCLWIEKFPNAAQAYYWRGWVLERLNHPKGAMDDYQQALKLNPNFTSVRLRVAEMLLDDHQPLEAAPHLEQLLKQFPDRADVMARLGQCRYLQNQRSEARRLLQAAVVKLPEDPTLLLHLAKLDVEDGNAIEAETWLRQLLKVDPADTEGLATLVTALQLQGRRREAEEAQLEWKSQTDALKAANDLLKQEAVQPSKDPNKAAQVGLLLLRFKQERQGLYWLDQALQRDPEHQEAHKALAEYFERKGNAERAAFHRRHIKEAEGKPVPR
jgi:Tfp pilus assembly protein PilF